MKKVGYLKVIKGNMNSGKSSALIQELQKIKNTNPNIFGTTWKCLIINSTFDLRAGDENISTKDPILNEYLIRNPTHFKVVKVTLLDEATPYVSEYDIILIDEAQFYKDIYITVRKWKFELFKRLYAFGLSGTFKQEPFGDFLSLIAMADDEDKLKAYCVLCHYDGLLIECSFSNYIGDTSNGVLNPEKENEENTKYLSVCQKHHTEVTDFVEQRDKGQSLEGFHEYLQLLNNKSYIKSSK